MTVSSLQSFLKVYLADHTLMSFLILQNSATSAAQPKLGTTAAAKAAEAQAAVQPADSNRGRSGQLKAPGR